MTDRHLILTANALLVGGLMASFPAGRLRAPSLVLFLGIGMLVGTDALGLFTERDRSRSRNLLSEQLTPARPTSV